MQKMSLNKREILKYVGDFSQVFGTKDYTLSGGKAQGVRAIDVKNGSGLEFTVLPDRGLDIAWLSYKGSNISYISKTGIVAPEYYNEAGTSFFRNFFAGFLTTCGLMNVGSPCEDHGESFGLHGRISNTPAEEVYSGTEWIDGQPVLKIRGRMREAKVFGENVTLDREITCRVGDNKLTIRDTVENNGFRKEPLMLLYHFNMGYPMLDEHAYLVTPTLKVEPRDEEAQKGVAAYHVFQKPTPDYLEQVFYHDLRAASSGATCVALINEELGLGVAIRFNKNQLFNLVQWKQMGEGEYVLGIEPSNCFVGGREDARKTGVLDELEPGEVRAFEIEAEILEGAGDIRRIKDEIAAI
ncbi:aldose 1-epimerase family protein [Paenibacillus dakarensis]|uniref:aldose 1-epimerase family protein n=1 Tax=Paenibacillus dakarensis TaxID=1527293 RepID=UPI0006D59455|nr:aldose 1-epimerase family protein [Paenibacillus dakarensis]